MNDDQVTSSQRAEEPSDCASVGGTHSRVATRRRFMPQVSILTLLLGMALFAVWLSNWQAGQSIECLELQMPGLRSVSRKLHVDDPSQFAVVKKVDQWYGENICEIHVPADQPYRLCLAMDAIDDDGFSDPLHVVSLPAGEHRIEIRYDTDGDESIARVLLDDQPAIEEARPKDWEPHVGSTGGVPFTRSTQYPADGPVVLLRRRFMIRSVSNQLVEPTSPSAGILVWVESDKME